MKSVITLKKGLDIHLAGKAPLEIQSTGIVDAISITPDDYIGLTPRVLVKVGEEVKSGSPILSDKNHPEIVVVSPVSGTVDAIVRGEKRRLIRVLIKPDNKQTSASFSSEPQLDLTREELLNRILSSGVFTYFRQRPYDVIPNPQNAPRDIFISTFDSTPLAADQSFLILNQMEDFQTGLEVLSRLTDGKVYLSISENDRSKLFSEVKHVEKVFFKGPHPAGNVGVQMNHIKPVNKGETVWTIKASHVPFLGQLFRLGKVDFSTLIAVCGPGVRRPAYVKALPGTPVQSILNGLIYKEMHARIIDGNPLTGKKVDPDAFIGYHETSVTVLKEGDDVHEFFGWIMPRMDKFSMSRTYLSAFFAKFFPSIRYEPDTRLLGGRRALIVSGEYDQVFPMDILPEQLIRACITKNIEKQEQLGIYEVAPEDFALCEYVCTSKLELQKIVRQALDELRLENAD